MHSTPVLIVGAGPTGLVLALSLARRGVPFRIVDQATGPGERSRAVVVHARTLEFYQQFGFAAEVVNAGIPAGAGHLRRGDAANLGEAAKQEIVHFHFKDLGEGISPFPYVLFYPQDDHEKMLLAKLRELGIEVERNTSLTRFEQDSDGVHATLERAGQDPEVVETRYLCGCDGAHSAVRQGMGVGFPGGSYDQLFYVADVLVSASADRDVTMTLGENTLCMLVPVRKDGSQRLLGLVSHDLSNRSDGARDLQFTDIQDEAEALLGKRVTEVRWFSTYHVHHRVADHFRLGRAFLLGDAGHIHSPAGGQGMNTGIGDAINLGWKLASVVQNRAAASLLDTYEPERISFARTLVKSTDRAFTGMVGSGLQGELFRRVLAPALFTVATRFAWTRHMLFRRLSQVGVEYEESTLSNGEAGGVEAGDRLPWTGFTGEDNFAPLTSLDWQVHVYGTPGDHVATLCRDLGLPLHSFTWNDAAKHAGLKRNATYFLRPDGYVALAAEDSGEGAAARLAAYAERLALQFNPVGARQG